MNIETLKAVMGWWTAITFALLSLSGIILTFAGDFVYRIHSRWFQMSRETFNIIIYSFMGFFKILFFVFCLTPWLALIIAT